jgi:hypothetical protein
MSLGSDLNAVLDNPDLDRHNRPCDIVADIDDAAMSFIYFSSHGQ